MTEGSGLNSKQLYLNNEAGTRVAAEFDKMYTQLRDLKNWVMGLNTDLGMGACREGQSWNDLFHDLVKGDGPSMVKAIEACMDKVKFLATQARAAQKEFGETDHGSASSFQRLDPHNAHPPIQVHPS